MKTNQIKKKKAKAVILSLLCSKEVSHCHLHFGRNAKAGGGVGELYSGKKEGFRCALTEGYWLREAVDRLTRKGAPIGLGNLFGFLFLES